MEYVSKYFAVLPKIFFFYKKGYSQSIAFLDRRFTVRCISRLKVFLQLNAIRSDLMGMAATGERVTILAILLSGCSCLADDLGHRMHQPVTEIIDPAHRMDPLGHQLTIR